MMKAIMVKYLKVDCKDDRYCKDDRFITCPMGMPIKLVELQNYY